MNKKIKSLSMMFASGLSIESGTCEEVYICPKCLRTRIVAFYGLIRIMEGSKTRVHCSKCKTSALDYLKFCVRDDLSHRLDIVLFKGESNV